MSVRRLVCLLILAAALLPSLWLAWTFRDQPQFGRFHDDSIYVVNAKSLAEGSGYRILSFPGAPYQTKYPPLYPAMLALIWRLNPDFPGNLGWMAALSWVSFAVFVAVCVAAFLRMGLGEIESSALAAVAALTPAITYYSSALMPDLLFCAVMLAALLAADRGRGATAGALGAAAFLLKSLVLPLAGTVPLLYAWRRKWRAAAAFCGLMLPVVGGWLLWARWHTVASNDTATLYYTNYLGYHVHIGALQNQALLVWKNLGSFFSEFGSLLIFDFATTPAGIHVSRLLTFAAIFGVVRMTRQGRFPQYVLFGAAFFVQSLMWHFPPSERFLFPVFPLMLAGLYVEGKNLTLKLAETVRRGTAGNRVVAAAAVPLLLALVWIWASTNVRTLAETLPGINRQHRELLVSARQDYRWLRDNLPAGERILSYYDPVTYLYTGRESCRLTLSTIAFYREDREEIRGRVRSIGDFARSHGMKFLYWTAGDFHTDLYGEERARAQEFIEKGSGFAALRKTGLSTVFAIPE